MTFTADASRALGGPEWLARRRIEAWERFSASSLPSASDDLWKYSGVDELDLESYSPAKVPVNANGADQLRDRADETARRVGERSGLVVTLDGRIVAIEDSGTEGLSVRSAVDEPSSVLVVRDALDELHGAFVQEVVEVDFSDKTATALPLVVIHFFSGVAEDGNPPAYFPHLDVRVGGSAEAKVVEVFLALDESSTGGLIFPVTELDVSDNARLSYATLQLLPRGWRQLAVQAGRVGRDASLNSFSGSLGAGVGRLRADAELAGQGGEASLVAGYLGDGNQLHDLRTVQDHVAPRTRSQLLCVGAVTDVARSAYVGLTRIRNGAHGADAFQTNRNLVLSEGAHADSVPELDIQENDVRCSHASTVGPIDEEQLYYLESRGIDPEVAERLIVLGFFNDFAGKAPVAEAGKWFMESVSQRLTGHKFGSAASDG